MTTLLESKQLSKSYTLGKHNEQRVLKNVDMTITTRRLYIRNGAIGFGQVHVCCTTSVGWIG